MADELKTPNVPEGKIEITGGEGMNIDLETKASPSALEKSQELEIGDKSGEKYNEALKKVQTHQILESDDQKISVQTDAEQVYQKNDAESRVNHLVDIAIEKGPLYAVKVARHLQDNYVLDVLHDRLLTEELHQALVDKKLIDEN